MITSRQEKLLDFLVKEYIKNHKPVSSKTLKKVANLDVCGATIRNDLQQLTKKGYIKQPHTSAGRIPTPKAYQYFADKLTSERNKLFVNFIMRQIEVVHKQLEKEMGSLMEIAQALERADFLDSERLLRALAILGPTKEICEENKEIINRLIDELNKIENL